MTKVAQPHKPDLLLLAITATLIIFGLLMVYNASSTTAYDEFGDRYYFIRAQLIWAAFGGAFLLFLLNIKYTFWEKLSLPLLILSIILLLLVFVPNFGITAFGAQRWLDLKYVSIQPAELAKLTFIIYLASFLSKKVDIKRFLFLVAVFAAIVLVQSDLGTATIITIVGFGIYFLAGGSLVALSMLIPLVTFLGFLMIFISSYRRARFFSFLDPTVDPQGTAYHINQILIALGSGGLFGVGLGESRQKYGFIPAISTDSIFAILGNELGFIGSVILILGFLIFIYRGFYISKKSPDRFSRLLSGGITFWIAIQALINLGGMVALIPLTGVPLPFISYGGSALVTTLVGVGILANVSRYTKKTQVN